MTFFSHNTSSLSHPAVWRRGGGETKSKEHGVTRNQLKTGEIMKTRFKVSRVMQCVENPNERTIWLDRRTDADGEEPVDNIMWGEVCIGVSDSAVIETFSLGREVYLDLTTD
jgi:hypothetical protein